MFGLGPKVPTIEAEDLKKALDEKSDVVIIDVRTPGEFSKGHIKGSINLPVSDVAANIEKTISAKDKTIILYCLSGSRSVFAVDMLVKLGYSNVFDLKSGLLAWRSKQYPLEN